MMMMVMMMEDKTDAVAAVAFCSLPFLMFPGELLPNASTRYPELVTEHAT